MTAAIAKYYTLIESADGTAMTLDLDPGTEDDCRRACAWQLRGAPMLDVMHIAEYDAASKAFVSVFTFNETPAHPFYRNGGRKPIEVRQSPYNDRAWDEFQAKLEKLT